MTEVDSPVTITATDVSPNSTVDMKKNPPSFQIVSVALKASIPKKLMDIAFASILVPASHCPNLETGSRCHFAGLSAALLCMALGR